MKNMKRREFLKTAAVGAVAAGCLTVGMSKLHAHEESDMKNRGKEFKPGDKVKTSGIYNVIHDRIDGEHHAQQHQVIAIAGTVFPRCKGCREWVRFRLSQAVQYLDQDPHFER